MNRKPRWGMVGTGWIARMAAGDLHLAENLELAAVASRSNENAEAFATKHEVPRWYGDYEALFNDDTIDLVYIGTPIGTHFEVARQALLAGKHVLLEKAFTMTAAEARALVRLAADQGRFLMEAMWTRFNPAIVRLLAEIADGAIGEVRTAQASFGFPPPVTTTHWTPELGGGALLDKGVYPLTFAHLILGAPQAVEATGEMRADGLDLTASVYLRYDDGKFATALTSIRGFISAGASVGGTEGMITLTSPFHATNSYSVSTPPFAEPRLVSEPREGNGYVPMFRAVSQALADGLLEHPWRPLSDTLEVMDILDEVRAQLAAAEEPTAVSPGA